MSRFGRNDSLLSPHWYRVSYVKPRLKSGVRIARQTVRGALWYVLTDPVSGRHHRFDRRAYALISGCDGHRSIDDLWAQQVDALGDEAPTQAEAIEVFTQAMSANLLAGNIAPDAAAVMRAQAGRRKRRRRAALNPLAFRLPLWDPDAFLSARVHRVAGLFGPTALRVWIALLVLATAVIAWHFGDLARAASGALAGGVEVGRFLLLLWIVYPVIKALHEAAHAFAIKAYGGEVHEVGITLLMLTPVPYVDASSAAAFEHKRERVVVGAAGIAVEWLLSGAAVALWVLLEPGLLRDLAAAVVVVGGVSTLLINGNPLLRFDGYHVLADALELPNLATRSARWWQAGLKRVLLGHWADRPERARGSERAWLTLYAPASWLCRSALALVLAFTLADWSPMLGLAFLALSLWWVAAGPAIAASRWLLQSPQLHRVRARAMTASAAGTAAVALVALTLPLPHRTLAPGAVWVPDEAQLRAGTEGFVDAVLVREGETVAAGTPLVRLRNEVLEQSLRRTEAELTQVRVERLAWMQSPAGEDMLKAAQAADREVALVAERDRLAQRVAELELRAAVAGRVAIDLQRLPVGRWLPQGETAGYVLQAGAPMVRSLVANEDIARVREARAAVQVQLAHADGHWLPAAWSHAVPQATTELVAPALAESAGGPIALDPADRSGRTAARPRFIVDVRLPEGVPAHVGARAWVAFAHGSATPAELLADAVRRAFLRHFTT